MDLDAVTRWCKPVLVPLQLRSVHCPASPIPSMAGPTCSLSITRPASWPQTSQVCINTVPMNHLKRKKKGSRSHPLNLRAKSLVVVESEMKIFLLKI